MKKLSLLFLIILALSIFYYLYYSKTSQPSPYQVYAQDITGTYRIGFTNLDQEIHLDTLPTTGKIPAWLSGTFFRNGPAKFTAGNSWVSNWFDGLAMIHAFSFDNGVVSYTNKFLKTDDYKKVEKTGRMSYIGFLQDPCSSKFKYLFSFFIPGAQEKKWPRVPNANVSISSIADKLIALTEIPLPVEFDHETLETVGPLSYGDGLPESRIQITPHPQYDPERKEQLGYFTKFARKSTYNLYAIKDGSTQRRIIVSMPVSRPSYMHSFAITEHYAILTALPLVVNPLSFLLENKAFIKNFKWKPKLGTELLVIDRINNTFIGSFKTEPFFAFHTVNAFEQDNTIVLDVVTYPDSAGIGKANMDVLLAPEAAPKPTGPLSNEHDISVLDTGILTRFTLSLDNKSVTRTILSKEQIELPRINYEKHNSKPYTYVYGYAKTCDCPLYVANKLVKINVNTGQVKNWHEEKKYPSEPVFIGSPDSKSEDDGIILSVILDAKAAVSFLLILDAKSFTELARAYVPHHIPFGIHGEYFKNK